jgi:exosome complex exonuclease DIS3/RRP44
MIAKAVAGELRKENEELKKEVTRLRKEVDEMRHQGIVELQDKIDELEQYSRRSCLRISNVPEREGENTENLVLAVAEIAGVSLPPEAIERSHRVGRAASFANVASGAAKGGAKGSAPRQIIVKLSSYKYREQLMRARKNLRSINMKARMPNLDWSSIPLPRRHDETSPTSTTPKVFINEDLTRERSRIAAKARELKRQKLISDTWTRDGVVFAKRNDSTILRMTTYRDLDRTRL